MVTTRYWLHGAGAAPAVVPATDPFWNVPGRVGITRPLSTVRDAGDSLTISGLAAPTGAIRNIICGTYVGPPLPAGPVSGDFRYVGAYQGTTSGNVVAQLRVRVVKPDGTTRGVLYAGNGALAGSTDPNSPAYVADTSTSLSAAVSRRLSGTFTPIVAEAGDRLSVEVGVRQINPNGTNRYARVVLGSDSAIGVHDFIVDQLSGNRVGWFEWITPDPPNPPTGLTVTDVGQTEATASWVAPASGTAPTSYDYRIDGGAPVSNALALSVLLTGFAPGTTHTVEARSVAASGASAWTAPVEFTTTDPQPPAPGIASQAVLSQVGLDPAPDGAAAPAQQWWDIDAADVATYSAVRSEGLFSYAIGYAAREPLGKPQPLSVGVVLLVPVGDAVAIGDRFLLRLSESLAAALDLDDTAAIRATCIVTDVQSDPSRTWTLPGHGPATLYNVTATGFLSRYGAARIDGSGWPTEPVGARIARILASLGLAGDVDTTGPDVLPPQVEGSHHQLLAPAIDSTTGRVVEQRDGTVDYHAADDRRGTLPALTLDAAEILGENFSWRQSVGDVVNEAEISYGADTGDKVVIRDPASADPRSGVGPYPQQISTVLADQLDAYNLGTEIVGRRAWPYYQLPAVTIDLARSGLDLDRLATAYEIASGDRVALTSMPDGSPWDTLPRGCFIEGYTETATAHAWRLSLVVSDPALSGVSLRYIDVPEGVSYAEVAAGISYLDVARIEDPADLT